MDKLVQIILIQGFALLVGLALVSFIRPTTTAGAILLMLVALAAINALQRAAKFVFGSGKDISSPPNLPPKRED
jgi:hypothetical protein